MSKTIFLSYSRGDDEPFVLQLYNDLIKAGFEVWFDRKCMPSRRLTFYQEIRDAISAADRLILVLGPQAITSDYVRQEWQFAWFAAEKVVIPILRMGQGTIDHNEDFQLVPEELKLMHCEDFRKDAEYAIRLKQLVRILREPDTPLGRLIGVPSLPTHFISRNEILSQLRAGLRVELDDKIIISTAAAKVELKSQNHLVEPQIGLHGMGGIGKSVLAAAVVRDRKVREAFSDGIVWITLGVQPILVELLRRIHRDLGGDSSFATEHEGRESLRKLLKHKSVLLVLDDAWQHSDIDSFDVLGAKCRLLITTRDLSLLNTLGGKQVLVELLSDREAFELIATTVDKTLDDLPAEAALIIDECGRLPLAVAICAGMIRSGREWSEVLKQLRSARIDRLADRHAILPQHRSVWHTIHVSIRFLELDKSLQAYQPHLSFLDLAVFPSDEAIPDSAIATLWSHTNNLDDWESQNLLMILADHSLLQVDTDTETGTGKTLRRITLHDLVYDYLQLANVNPTNLHQQLLTSYEKKYDNGWTNFPDDGYIYGHLIRHLHYADREDEIHALLREEDSTTRAAWYEALERLGQTSGFLSDIDFALKIATRFLSVQPTTAIGHQCFYTLIFSSINSLAGNISITVLIALTRTKVWSPEQALAYACQMPQTNLDSWDLRRAHGVSKSTKNSIRTKALSELSFTFAETQQIEFAFMAIRSIDQPIESTLAAARIAAILPDPAADDAYNLSLATVEAVNNLSERVSLLLTLAKMFPKQLGEDAIVQAYKMAQRIEDLAKRMSSLESLFQALPPDQSAMARINAFDAAARIMDEERRARALVRLAVEQPVEKLEQSISIALEAALSYETNEDKGMWDEHPEWDEQDEIRRDFAILLLNLGRFETAFELANATGIRRKDAFDELALVLATSGQAKIAKEWRDKLSFDYSPKTNVRILLEEPELNFEAALALALAVTDAIPRLEVLVSMNDFVPKEKQREIVEHALKAADEIEAFDSHVRDRKLKKLGEQLSASGRFDLVMDMIDACGEYNRAELIIKMVERLPASLYGKVFDSIQKFDDTSRRIEAIVVLIPQVQEPLLSDCERIAFDTFLSLDHGTNVYHHKESLIKLIEQLPQHRIHDVLAHIRSSFDQGKRVELLIAAISRVSHSTQAELVTEILEGIGQLDSTIERMAALSNLAPKVSPEQLRLFLPIFNQVRNKKYWACLLVAWASYLPKNKRHKAIKEAFKIIEHLEPKKKAAAWENLLLEAIDYGLSKIALDHVLKLEKEKQQNFWKAFALKFAAQGNFKDCLLAIHAIDDSYYKVIYMEDSMKVFPEPIPKILVDEAVKIIEEAKEKIEESSIYYNQVVRLVKRIAAEKADALFPLVNSFSNISIRIGLLVELLPFLKEHKNQIKVEVLSHIKSLEMPRLLQVVAKMSKELSKNERQELLNEVMLIFKKLKHNYSMKGDISHLALTCAILGHAKEAIELVSMKGSLIKNERVSVLMDLLNYLPPSLQEDTLTNAFELAKEYEFSWDEIEQTQSSRDAIALSTMAREFAKIGDTQRVFQALGAIEITGYKYLEQYLVKGIVWTAEYLPENALLELLELTREVKEPVDRSAALIEFVGKLNETISTEIINEVLLLLSQTKREFYEHERLHNLIPRLLQLGHLSEAIDVIQLLNEKERSAKLIGLLDYPFAPSVAVIVELIIQLKNTEYRIKALRAAVPKMLKLSIDDQQEIWSDTLSVMIGRNREEVAADLCSLTPLMFAIGGEKSILLVYDAACNVSRWW